MQALKGVGTADTRHPPRERDPYMPRGEGVVASLLLHSAAQATLARLQQWDLDVVARYAVREGVYKASEIVGVVAEYRKYMALAMTCKVDGIPISKRLDDFWHTHILFTQDYAAMCQAVAGRFIHHRPRILDDEAGLVRAFEYRTLELYRDAFGEPDRSMWDSTLCKCGPDD